MGRKQKCCHEIKWSLQMKWQHFAQQSKHAELHHQQKLIWNLKMFPWKGNHLHIINFGVPCYFAVGSMTTLSLNGGFSLRIFLLNEAKNHGVIFASSTSSCWHSSSDPFFWLPSNWLNHRRWPVTNFTSSKLAMVSASSRTNPRGCIFPVPKIIKSIATQ